MRAQEKQLPKVIGRYEVVRLLGVGAMGRVMLALDPVLGREVAIKILRHDLAIPEDVREGLVVRMRHEAQAAARVTHPNLVVLHDMGEDAELGLYLVFELLDGPTLREKIAEKRLSPRAASRLARELGGALAFAHARGVLHRDVKPDNIMLTPTGAKIADFGIARVPDSTLTHAGGLMGTPAYSAPETFQKGAFSPASDQFSLATTMYEAISGERAFPGDDAVLVAARIASSPPDRFAARLGYRPELDDVLLRAMAPLPAERFETCEAFGSALARALSPVPRDEEPRTSDPPRAPRDADARRPLRTSSDGADAAPPVDTVSRPPAKGDRKPWQVLLGGFVVVVVVALLVRAVLKNRDAALAEAPTAPPPTASVSASATPARAPEPHNTRPHHTVAPAQSALPPPSASVSAEPIAPSASASADTSAVPISSPGSAAPAPSAAPSATP